jgi:hypothetical protein
MYRELVVRAYGEEAIKKVDKLRKSGVDMTDLIMSAIMLADIKEVLREQRAKRELVCA